MSEYFFAHVAPAAAPAANGNPSDHVRSVLAAPRGRRFNRQASRPRNFARPGAPAPFAPEPYPQVRSFPPPLPSPPALPPLAAAPSADPFPPDPRPSRPPRSAHPSLSRYERRKRRVLHQTAGQTWVYFAAYEALPYTATVAVVTFLLYALGILT
ncbi:MAG: hypothetical protein M0026_21760 [Nocardiopsaceae bacterium]|nr:hypothetical protein [Nocardiopsaceae bacterium]